MSEIVNKVLATLENVHFETLNRANANISMARQQVKECIDELRGLAPEPSKPAPKPKKAVLKKAEPKKEEGDLGI